MPTHFENVYTSLYYYTPHYLPQSLYSENLVNFPVLQYLLKLFSYLLLSFLKYFELTESEINHHLLYLY